MTPRMLTLIALTMGCQEAPEAIPEEFEEASDIPQPSRDLDNDDEDQDIDDTDDDDTDDDTDDDDDTDPQPADPVEYSFDSDTSLIYVQVFKDPSAFGSAFAHDHVMRAENFDGEVIYNPEDLSDCDVYFSVPVEQLQVDESGMRELVGYGDSLSSSDRATIREHMLDSNQLNANAYSTIDFVSTSCSGDDGTSGTLTVDGGLTVRGRTANVSLPIRFEIDGGNFYAQASFEMNHAEFGMEPYSAFGGAVRNDDPLRFTLDVVGYPN